jgi:hypothetical protein
MGFLGVWILRIFLDHYDSNNYSMLDRVKFIK